MKTIVISILIAVYWKNYARSQNDDVNPLRLSDAIQGMVNSRLKLSDLQSYLDSLEYEEKNVDEGILDSMALRIGTKVEDRVGAVQTLQQGIRNASKANTGESSILNCCKIENVTFNPTFIQEIDTSQSCVLLSNQHDGRPFKDLSFTDIAKKNVKKVPDLKTQLFGSERSSLRVYPSFKVPTCRDSFDTRLRPWYVQANSPTPKQVIVVIDKSGSMLTLHNGVSRMELAKQAAKSVVSTLNPHDKFSVIAFSETPETIRALNGQTSCFSFQLVPATPQNQLSVNKFVDTIQAQGGTGYGNALLKAFDFFENEFFSSTDGSGQGSRSADILVAAKTQDIDSFDRVILFMSDGAPEDPRQSIFNKLDARSQRLNHSVLIMTYGVGDEDFSILRDIAVHNPDPSKKGEFVQISDPRRLRNEMSSFYKIFSKGGENITQPVWTVPYFNIQTFALVVGASLPVYVDGTFIGVAGLVAGIRELFVDPVFLKLTPKSYAFLMDATGLVITHPLFPHTQPVATFVLATAFEQDPEFLPVFESMKRGESGSLTFMATRIDENFAKKRVLSTYVWKQIPHGNYSLCAVFPANSSRLFLTTDVSYKPGSMLYHRMDLIPPSAPCNYFGSLSSLNQSAVFLASRAFVLSVVSSTHHFTTRDVTGIIDFIENAGNITFLTSLFKDYVREEIFITDKAQSLWTSSANVTDFNRNFLCQYIATDGGVFRIFPAIRILETYDPTTRIWYQQAVAAPNKIVISTPYFLPTAGIHVVTISHALFIKRKGNSKSEESVLFGVTGLDMQLKYFIETFTDLYPNNDATVSRKTYLMDSAGDLIYDESFGKLSKHNVLVKATHLAEVEPEITSVLIKRGILQRISCSLLESSLVKHSYKTSMNETAFNFSYKVGGIYLHDAVIIPVPKTNGFLVFKYILEFNVQRLNVESGHAKLCQCSSKRCRTSWTKIDECECPCVAANPHYNPCKNEYSRSSPPPCFPLNTSSITSIPIKASMENLPVCFQLFDSNDAGPSSTVIIVAASLSLVVVLAIAFGLLVIRYKQRQRKIAATKRFKTAFKRQNRKKRRTKRSKSRRSIAMWLRKISQSFGASKSDISI